MSGFIGKGDIYVDRDINGNYLLIGNVTKFEISETEADTKERVSKQRDTYGQALDSIILPKPATISLSLDEINAQNMAMALRGLIETETVSSGSVSAEAHDNVQQGQYIKLNYSNVSSVVVKDDQATPTTFNEGDDYNVNARLGMIEIVEGGAIANGTNLRIDYDYGDGSGTRIKAGRVTEIECAILLDGQNMVDSKDCRVEVYKCKLRPASAVDFLADDFQTLELTGTIITPEDKTEGYNVVYVD